MDFVQPKPAFSRNSPAPLDFVQSSKAFSEILPYFQAARWKKSTLGSRFLHNPLLRLDKIQHRTRRLSALPCRPTRRTANSGRPLVTAPASSTSSACSRAACRPVPYCGGWRTRTRIGRRPGCSPVRPRPPTDAAADGDGCLARETPAASPRT